jgi:hypothetical protein
MHPSVSPNDPHVHSFTAEGQVSPEQVQELKTVVHTYSAVFPHPPQPCISRFAARCLHAVVRSANRLLGLIPNSYMADIGIAPCPWGDGVRLVSIGLYNRRGIRTVTRPGHPPVAVLFAEGVVWEYPRGATTALLSKLSTSVFKTSA